MQRETKIKISLFLIILFFVILYIILPLYNLVLNKMYPYTAGKTGIYCYKTGNAHGNTRYHIYFKTLEECEIYVRKNREK